MPWAAASAKRPRWIASAASANWTTSTTSPWSAATFPVSGVYAKVDTGLFRLLKAHTPGPYTFILSATREVPRMLLHPKRRTIGLRVPNCPIARALLEELGEPLMSVSLIMPGSGEPLNDPYEMRQVLEHQVDLIVDGGYGGGEASTVISLTDTDPEVIRVGCGDPAPFMQPA